MFVVKMGNCSSRNVERVFETIKPENENGVSLLKSREKVVGCQCTITALTDLRRGEIGSRLYLELQRHSETKLQMESSKAGGAIDVVDV